MARKLTILSRHIPSLMHMLPHGYVSVDTASLVPEALENIATGDEFLAKLPEFDAHFDQLRAEAAREGMVLRFVGVVDVAQKRIKAGLEKCVLLLPLISAHVCSWLCTKGTLPRIPSRRPSLVQTISSRFTLSDIRQDRLSCKVPVRALRSRLQACWATYCIWFRESWFSHVYTVQNVGRPLL